VGGLAAVIAAGIGAMALRRMRASAPVSAVVTADSGDQATA
jgi:hypothetical protein